MVGITQRQFESCPNAPHCVSSQSADKKHFVEPLSYTLSLNLVHDAVADVLKNQSRTQVVVKTENYFHAECRTAVFRFVDDLEIYIDDEEKKIHFRSCSRVGYYDFNVNRNRVNGLKQELKAGLMSKGEVK